MYVIYNKAIKCECPLFHLKCERPLFHPLFHLFQYMCVNEFKPMTFETIIPSIFICRKP